LLPLILVVSKCTFRDHCYNKKTIFKFITKRIMTERSLMWYSWLGVDKPVNGWLNQSFSGAGVHVTSRREQTKNSDNEIVGMFCLNLKGTT